MPVISRLAENGKNGGYRQSPVPGIRAGLQVMTDARNDSQGGGPSGPEHEKCMHFNRPCRQVTLLGFVAGGLGALVGVGGGIIMIPVMTMWGLTQKRAQGTSLFVILAVVPLTIILYALLGNVDFGFAVPLAVGGIFGSVAGSALALRFSNRVLAVLFAVFLILVALKLMFMPPLEARSSVADFANLTQMLQAAFFGVFAGFAAGFFGVGGGIVFVPTGVLVAGLQQAVAQGSSFTAMLPTTYVATINYRRKKEVDWYLVRWMIPGSCVGVVLGSWGASELAKIYDGRVLTWLFALFLLYTAITRLIGKAGSGGNRPAADGEKSG